ncbi:MAG TPA: hypothetical protein VFT12_12655 [Thermoanaerobaculia bacterium]|nr:hypothetical protein [Thermoanaerobaculia bacterium]
MVRIALIFTALLMAAACQPETTTETAGGATPTSTATADRDVCSMATMDELQTAAGLVSATGMSSESGGADVCTWTGENGKIVVAQVFPSASSYDSARQAFESQYGGTAEDVSAVGDKAFFIGGNTGRVPTGTLVAQKGSTPISIQVMGGTSDVAQRRNEAVAVAHVILGKL